jgi:hypothetical protein
VEHEINDHRLKPVDSDYLRIRVLGRDIIMPRGPLSSRFV